MAAWYYVNMNGAPYYSIYKAVSKSKRALKGFTLIELIVVMAIVILSSGIVLFNYRGSRQAVVLSSTALDVANMVRIAQVGGRSAAQNLSNYNTTSEIIATNDIVRTGIHLAQGLQNTIAVLTVYRNLDGVFGYQPSGTPFSGDQRLEVKNTSAAGVSVRLCTSVNYATHGCTPYSQSASIEFSRLKSDPIDNGVFGTANPVIQLESTQGGSSMYRYVVIERTGNIFVR